MELGNKKEEKMAEIITPVSELEHLDFPEFDPEVLEPERIPTTEELFEELGELEPIELPFDPVPEEELVPLVKKKRSERAIARQIVEDLAKSDAPEFMTPNFNRDDFENILERNTFPKKAGRSIKIKDKDDLKEDLENFINRGIEQALSSENRGEALNGLVISVRNFLTGAPKVRGVSQMVSDILHSKISPDFVRLLTQHHAVNVSDLFKGEIENLDEQKLDQNQIDNVVDEFNRNIRTSDVSTSDIKNIQDYINEHVSDPGLKERLTNELSGFSAVLNLKEERQEKRFTATRQFSEARRLEIDTSARRRLAQTIRSELNNVKTRRALQDIIDEIDILSDVSGFQLSVAEGARRPVPGKIPKEFLAGFREDQRRQLNDLLDRIEDKEIKVSYIPVAVDEGEMIDINKLTSLLREDLSNINKTDDKDRHDVTRIRHPRSTGRRGNIKIKKGKDIRRTRELEFPPNSSSEDLLKIALSLKSENGDLEDIDGNLLLRIIKGTTSLRDIMAVLLNEQKHNFGRTIRFLYVPLSPVGGQFLDGYLQSLHKNAILKPMPFRINTLHPSKVGGALHKFKSQLLNIPMHRYYHPMSAHTPPFNKFAKGNVGGSIFGLATAEESQKKTFEKSQQNPISGGIGQRELF